MRITTRGRYALRASLAMAKLSKNNEPVSINTLSEQEGISSVFLEQIFFKLRKAGIVSSIRGPGGGFCFALSLDKLTVKEIFNAVGEEIELIFCDKHNDTCKREGECMSHNIFTEVTKIVDAYFSGLTLAYIIEKYGKIPVPVIAGEVIG